MVTTDDGSNQVMSVYIFLVVLLCWLDKVLNDDDTISIVRPSSSYLSKHVHISSLFLLQVIISLYLIYMFRLNDLMFPYVLTVLLVLFHPYLAKPSTFYEQPYKMIDDGGSKRSCHDSLMLTSFVYLIGALYAFYYEMYFYTYMTVATFIGSLLYHRYKEARYFNFDNLFAQSTLLFYMWTIYLSYPIDQGYFYFGVIAVPSK